MGDSSWVIEHFQVGRVQRFELSVGKTIYCIARSRFQWRRGRQNHSGYLQYLIYRFRVDIEKYFFIQRDNGPLAGKVVRLAF